MENSEEMEATVQRDKWRDKGKQEPPFRCRTVIELDMNLANALGNFILDSKCKNQALVALAFKLVET